MGEPQPQDLAARIARDLFENAPRELAFGARESDLAARIRAALAQAHDAKGDAVDRLLDAAERVLVTAEPVYDRQGAERVVVGYQHKTGAMHSLLGIVRDLGRPCATPPPPEPRKMTPGCCHRAHAAGEPCADHDESPPEPVRDVDAAMSNWRDAVLGAINDAVTAKGYVVGAGTSCPLISGTLANVLAVIHGALRRVVRPLVWDAPEPVRDETGVVEALRAAEGFIVGSLRNQLGEEWGKASEPNCYVLGSVRAALARATLHEGKGGERG